MQVVYPQGWPEQSDPRLAGQVITGVTRAADGTVAVTESVSTIVTFTSDGDGNQSVQTDLVFAHFVDSPEYLDGVTMTVLFSHEIRVWIDDMVTLAEVAYRR